MNKIVIIGFGSAGYAALMAVKKRDPKANVVIIDPKKHDIMHSCGLPYSLEGHIKAKNLYQDIFLNRMGVEKIIARCVGIDGKKKIIKSVTNEDRELETAYDSAIIALGSKPFMPPIKGIEKAYNKGLFTMTTVDELERIKESLNNAINGIVIGAGAIGLETATGLYKHLNKVIVLEKQNQVLPGILDADFSKIVEEHIRNRSIELYLESLAEEILYNENFKGVISSGIKYDGDIGILSTGFKANIELAKNSGIECDDKGIKVDSQLRTSIPGVLAAGDCISAWSVIDGRPVPVKLATCAYKQGVIAGINAMGGTEEYKGTAGTFVTKICHLEISGTGYTTEAAGMFGYEPVSGKIKAGIMPDYFHGGSEINLKIICDKKTGTILGAQAIGLKGAAERINIISMAIELDISIEDLMRVEFAYCPAVSEVMDPLHKAIEFAKRRM